MPARARPKTARRGYGGQHQAKRAGLAELVASGRATCARCGEPIEPGEPWDLGHDDENRQLYQGPEHRRCNRATRARRHRPLRALKPPEPEPERHGVDAADPCWQVPWLQGLLEPPDNAVWPRLMTVPHPAAAGSLGAGFVDWAEARSGRPLRWWQRLVAARLLETDAAGELVWRALILSMARQLGKSWLLRELLLWRIHQRQWFGEPQDVIHTGRDVAICKEVQRPARIWAKGYPGLYKVREVNGQEEIEFKADGSRWMLRAKDAVYGYSVSVAAADEAWKVKASSIDEGLWPTMIERIQPQLLLVSTAHRLATSLMLGRRQAALAELETGRGDLLIEWSAPRDARLDDYTGWRYASPHWTPQRQQLIGQKLAAMHAGEIDDPDEPDPEQSFRAQWLNQWPQNLTVQKGAGELLPAGLWADLAEPGLESVGPIWVALEDDFGYGAAGAAVGRLPDGRLEVDGWVTDDWESALTSIKLLSLHRTIKELYVGASMLRTMPPGTTPSPRPAGSRETRAGLPLLRELAAGGRIAHDTTTDKLDAAVAAAQVKEQATGLTLVPGGHAHLVKALVWALHAAARPTPLPAVF